MASAVDYAERGLIAIPVDVETKRPLVRGWQRFGPRSYQRSDLRRYTNANLGILCGDSVVGHRITIIDVDDPSLINYAIDTFGDAVIKVKSPRPGGGLHLWYKGNGERKQKVRDSDGRILAIDLLATSSKGTASYCVAPPSARSDGPYVFVDGDLDFVDQLKPVHPQESQHNRVPRASEGNRNNALFRSLCTVVHGCSHIDQLREEAIILNETNSPRLETAEVKRLVENVWRMKLEGRAYAPERHGGGVYDDEIAELTPQTGWLLMRLRANHGIRREPFALPKSCSKSYGMGETAFCKHRNYLVRKGFIVPIRAGMKNRANLYTWPSQ